MTAGALVFMASSWGFVLGLTAWSFARIMRNDGASRGPSRS